MLFGGACLLSQHAVVAPAEASVAQSPRISTVFFAFPNAETSIDAGQLYSAMTRKSAFPRDRFFNETTYTCGDKLPFLGV